MNLRSSKSSPDKTPNELFSRKKPSISHHRVFGTLAYVHQAQPGYNKLDQRSMPHILLSFYDQIKGYRCQDPIKKKIIVSKDIKILEVLVPSPTAYNGATSALYSNPGKSPLINTSQFSLPHLPDSSPLDPTSPPRSSSAPLFPSILPSSSSVPTSPYSPPLLTYQRHPIPPDPLPSVPCPLPLPSSPRIQPYPHSIAPPAYRLPQKNSRTICPLILSRILFVASKKVGSSSLSPRIWRTHHGSQP